MNTMTSTNSRHLMNTMAVVAGGGVRVGLEDNIWYDEKRTTLAQATEA